MLVTRLSRFCPTVLLVDEPVAGESSDRFLERLICEIHALAVDIAVTATAANSLNDWRCSVDHHEVARFAPQPVTIAALLTILEYQELFEAEISEALISTVADIQAARAELEIFLDDCEAISAARAGAVHARLLQARWRALAHGLRSMLLTVETSLSDRLPDIYRQNSRVVSALLNGAGNGLKPCLDDKGRLYIPPLPQRRRAPRRTVLQNCIVHHGVDQSQMGFLRDLSSGGLGLGRISGLKRGDRVKVKLASGRLLCGVVAWIKGNSAGVRFDVPLDPADGLIAV